MLPEKEETLTCCAGGYCYAFLAIILGSQNAEDLAREVVVVSEIVESISEPKGLISTCTRARIRRAGPLGCVNCCGSNKDQT